MQSERPGMPYEALEVLTKRDSDLSSLSQACVPRHLRATVGHQVLAFRPHSLACVAPCLGLCVRGGLAWV